MEVRLLRESEDTWHPAHFAPGADAHVFKYSLLVPEFGLPRTSAITIRVRAIDDSGKANHTL